MRSLLYCTVMVGLALGCGCKSGRSDADRVLSERTKQSESSKSSKEKKGSGEDAAGAEEQGASKSVIRLFDESEVDESEGGPVEIGGASDDSVRLVVDQSSCETFESSMVASIDKLDTSCESDADCALIELPCALGCSRAVKSYSNLDQVETFAEQYLEDCPDCKKACEVQSDWLPTCSKEGECVAMPGTGYGDNPNDGSDEESVEPEEETELEEETEPEEETELEEETE